MLLKPKSWEKFQHYKDRCPPWIKLHRDLLTDREFMCLPIASKAIAPLLWLLASESKDGSFDGSLDELQFRLHISKKDYEDGIKPLIDKGFFIVSSELLADCFRIAIPEREGETETETEVEAEKERKKEKKATVVACPSDVSEGVWNDWVALRKKKGTTISETAIDGARVEAQKIGWTLEQFLIEWCVRGSQGLKADWIKPEKQNLSQTGQMNQRVATGLTRGLIGGSSNVKLLGN